MAQNAKRLERIEDRTRGDLNNWLSQVKSWKDTVERASKANAKYDSPFFVQFVKPMERVENEMSIALNDLTTITQDLTAAKSDAEYREVLVRTWPANHFLDRMSYLGAALLGAGGAGYVLGGWAVAAVFWAVGLVLMSWALGGLRAWERKKWEFYADQFSVGDRYRPWKRHPAANLPSPVAVTNVESGIQLVTRTKKAAALMIVIAALFVWLAGYLGEKEFGTNIGFWIYWEAIIFLAAWTVDHAIWLPFGRTEHTVRMFGGRVLFLMFLASVLFVFMGPITLILVPTTIFGLGIMLAGVGLWIVAAADWAHRAVAAHLLP